MVLLDIIWYQLLIVFFHTYGHFSFDKHFLPFLGKRTRASQYTKKKEAVAPKSRSGRRDQEASSSSSNRYKTNKDSTFQPVSDIGVLSLIFNDSKWFKLYVQFM